MGFFGVIGVCWRQAGTFFQFKSKGETNSIITKQVQNKWKLVVVELTAKGDFAL